MAHLFKPRLEILAFHRILDRNESYFIPPMALALSTFERLIHKLSHTFDIISLSEAVALLNRDAIQHRTLAITFDDGYLDNYSVAKDFLSPAGIPATFFIPINQIDGGRPYWWDHVKSVADRAQSGFWKWLIQLSRAIQPGMLLFPAGMTSSADKTVLRQLIQGVNALSYEDRTIFLQSLEKEFGPYEGSRLLMDWDEIQDLCLKGFSIGSHTLSHEPLTDLDPTEARNEIEHSRSILADRLGYPIDGFCYPRGAFSDFLSEIVKQSGYSYAVTTRYASNKHKSDPFALSRRNISDYTGLRAVFPVAAIRLELSGVLDPLLSSRRS